MCAVKGEASPADAPLAPHASTPALSPRVGTRAAQAADGGRGAGARAARRRDAHQARAAATDAGVAAVAARAGVDRRRDRRVPQRQELPAQLADGGLVRRRVHGRPPAANADEGRVAVVDAARDVQRLRRLHGHRGLRVDRAGRRVRRPHLCARDAHLDGARVQPGRDHPPGRHRAARVRRHALAGVLAARAEEGGGGRRRRRRVAPPALLWLVQRDFLEGGSVDAYLREALKPADNPADDEHVGRLNRVREALGVFEAMRGMGLPQPHLQRTQLCSLPRSALAPEYLAAQGRLESYVEEQATRSRRPLDGRGSPRSRRSLSRRSTRSSCRRRRCSMPSTRRSSRRRCARCRRRWRRCRCRWARAHCRPSREAAAAAEAELAEQSLGASGTDDLRKAAAAVLKSAADANFVASQRVRCRGSGATVVRRLATSWPPSQRRFAAGLADCNASKTLRRAGVGGLRGGRRPGGARQGGVCREVLLAARARHPGRRRRRRARRALRRALVAVGALCWAPRRQRAGRATRPVWRRLAPAGVVARRPARRRLRAPRVQRHVDLEQAPPAAVAPSSPPRSPPRAQRRAAAEGGGVGGCVDKVA